MYKTRLDPPPAYGWLPPPLPTPDDSLKPEEATEQTRSRTVSEPKHQYATASPKSNSDGSSGIAPNLFEAPVPSLFDEEDGDESAPAPRSSVIGKATVNGLPVEILKIVQLDSRRTQYQVILDSTGEVKSYVSPPATVMMTP